jgi:hypothetical protein
MPSLIILLNCSAAGVPARCGPYHDNLYQCNSAACQRMCRLSAPAS